ncbi:universal stress protein [Natrialbaceae archaeon AArc-T1-2]|uniref:universal stress protein n=1 Tax=Natrialbaceae archaeon AArc-T1-2 TaxID=3053904 RepID=UPI00255AC6D9|nr:universal stress protein [Natrialbaceae archaeon AArc-T1-2]WIV68361.1 universal stress protein [Natrialbaceae archaeon AArc-T1-2]
MYDDVLLATDGSTIAATAAEQGLAIAGRFGSDVHVLSVVDDRGRNAVREPMRARCRRSVEDLAVEATDRNLAVETTVREGSPTREILAYADDRDVDLLVVGTRGRSGLGRLSLGSTALGVIRAARRPVLSAGPDVWDVSDPLEKILVATDGRPGVDAAVDQAIGLADAYDATVRVLSVADETRARSETAREAFERAAEKATNEVAVRAADRGVGVVQAVERGRPSAEILAYAEAHAVDLLVMGTEGRSTLERVVVGSVSQRVVSDAPVPVMTVRTVDDEA